MQSTKSFRMSLQLKLTLWFSAVAGSALVLALLMFSRELTALAADLPGAEGQFEHFSRAWLGAVRDSFLIVLPLMGLIGFLTGQRVARPARVLRRFLAEVAGGARPADCTLSASDELQDLCALANEATRSLRARPSEEPTSPGTGDADAAPSLLPAERETTTSADVPAR